MRWHQSLSGSQSFFLVLCTNGLSVPYSPIITVLGWILVCTVKYSICSDLSTKPSCFSSWLNRLSFYFASPSLLDCRRPARGRSAGFQGSAAGNKELLTSASKSHISEKEKERSEKPAYRFISVKVKIGCNLLPSFLADKIQCPL